MLAKPRVVLLTVADLAGYNVAGERKAGDIIIVRDTPVRPQVRKVVMNGAGALSLAADPMVTAAPVVTIALSDQGGHVTRAQIVVSDGEGTGLADVVVRVAWQGTANITPTLAATSPADSALFGTPGAGITGDVGAGTGAAGIVILDFTAVGADAGFIWATALNAYRKSAAVWT